MPDATHSPRKIQGNSSGRLTAVPGRHRDESPPNNLPSEFSSFVGREKELAEVGRLLKDARLLTLTGSGGCGKIRLALAAAGELAEGFEDGVWLVDLAPLADPSLVSQAVAAKLGWALWLFWGIRAHFAEGRRSMEQASSAGGSVAMPTSARAKAL